MCIRAFCDALACEFDGLEAFRRHHGLETMRHFNGCIIMPKRDESLLSELLNYPVLTQDQWRLRENGMLSIPIALPYIPAFSFLALRLLILVTLSLLSATIGFCLLLYLSYSANATPFRMNCMHPRSEVCRDECLRFSATVLVAGIACQCNAIAGFVLMGTNFIGDIGATPPRMDKLNLIMNSLYRHSMLT